MSQNSIPGQHVEVLAQDTNAWVVRTPGRQYPGIVIQGDALHTLFSLAVKVHERTSKGHDDDLLEDVQELHDLLSARLGVYERVLKEKGIPFPYSRA